MSLELSEVRQDMQAEVLEGLHQPQKVLPSKYFYDEKGSQIFEQITKLSEYYLTRAESQILQKNIKKISSCVGRRAVVIEPGSGSSKKTRLLLNQLKEVSAYLPVDISKEYLLKVVQSLKQEYPDLPIQPVCADYTKPFEIPDVGQSFERQIIFFPGSTIGNFEPEQARSFLQMISSILNADGALLIGVDLKKDQAILERAYNDAKGVTAQFNKNMLVRLNKEINTDFDVEAFAHYAFYNIEQGRVEMHLISQKDQKIHLNGEEISFREGETIHTENSYKYSIEDFNELVNDWFSMERVWTDDLNLFSIQYLEKR